MAASEEQNGHNSPTRLDRIEKTLEVLVQSHMEFANDHKMLLRAQVVLTDQVSKLTEEVRELRAAQAHTDERLNALISVVDDLVRKRPPL